MTLSRVSEAAVRSEAIADSILIGYYALPAFKRNTTVTIAQGDSFLLGSFTCPNDFQAKARAAHGVPVWLYRYLGDWPNIRLFPKNDDYPGQVVSQGSGAYHGTELEMVFGNPEAVSGVSNTVNEDEMIRLVQSAWAAFARDPKCGLTKLGWPTFDPVEDSLIRLGYGNAPTAQFMDPTLYTAGCGNYTPSG